MPKKVNDVLALIRRISGKDMTRDMLLEFEKVLDHVSLYAYKNWISGELVEGPDIDRYWFKTTWLRMRQCANNCWGYLVSIILCHNVCNCDQYCEKTECQMFQWFHGHW